MIPVELAPAQQVVLPNREKPGNSALITPGTEDARISKPKKERLIIAAQRMPVTAEVMPEDTPQEKLEEYDGYTRLKDGRYGVLVPSPGGLNTALGAVIKSEGFKDKFEMPVCIGRIDNKGVPEEVLPELYKQYRGNAILEGIAITEEESRGWYEGFSNEVLWKISHDDPKHTNYKDQEQYYAVYQQVQKKYADAIKRISEAQHPDKKADWVLIHDYQLSGVGEALDRLGVTMPKSFFLHIPFPATEMWKAITDHEIRRSLLANGSYYDLSESQTKESVNNFTANIKEDFAEETQTGEVAEIEREDGSYLRMGNRLTRLDDNLISIDPEEFRELAEDPEVIERAREIREKDFPGQTILMMWGRLGERTKRVNETMRAYASLFDTHPELIGKVALKIFGPPSRLGIQSNQDYFDETLSLEKEINEKYENIPNWKPVVVVPENHDRKAVAANILAAHVFPTATIDGCNLTPFEAAMGKMYGPDDLKKFVIITSPTAGAHVRLGKNALSAHPDNPEQLAEALYQAITMQPEEQAVRMQGIWDAIKSETVIDWFNKHMEHLNMAKERISKNFLHKANTYGTVSEVFTVENLAEIGDYKPTGKTNSRVIYEADKSGAVVKTHWVPVHS